MERLSAVQFELMKEQSGKLLQAEKQIQEIIAEKSQIKIDPAD